MEANKVFGGGAGAKAQEGDKLNIDSIIARLLEGRNKHLTKPRVQRSNYTQILTTVSL